MKKYLILCKNCIDRPESEYYCFLTGRLLWEGEMTNRSGFYCSKCGKVFKTEERFFVPKPIKKSKN